MTLVGAFLARSRRFLRSDDGFTLVELLVTMAILLTVFTAITGAFASGMNAETGSERRARAQLDARQALARMREDLNCAYAVQAVGPRDPSSDSGFYLYLTEQYNTCQSVDASATSGGSKVFLAWCTVPIAGEPGVYSLYRENLLGSGTPTSQCDTSGTIEATDIVAPPGGWPTNSASATPSTWNGNIWPNSLITCTSSQTNYLPTVGIDMAVNPVYPVPAPNAEYELKDQLTLRNGTRCGTAGTGGATGTTFTVSAPTPASPTAGSSFTVTLTAQLVGGGTDTTYGGTRTITFSGASNSPSGSAPVYPANVTFTNGVGTATITLYDAASTTLSATDGTKTGSSTFTVGAGTPAKLIWNASSYTGTLSSPCTTSCTWTGAGKNGTFTAGLSVTDAYGNAESNLGASKTVTLTNTSSGSWSPTSLTLPAAGAATTTGTAKYTGSNGNWSSTLTASSSGLSSATVAGSK
jgi:prepilin-type N-terminal cleavage/methylation domain-containing protein